MSNTLLITVNASLGLIAIAAVAALTYLAHHLPASAPHSDELWGTGGNPWVVTDPLPFRQLVEHENENERALARVA